MDSTRLRNSNPISRLFPRALIVTESVQATLREPLPPLDDSIGPCVTCECYILNPFSSQTAQNDLGHVLPSV